MSTDSPPSFTCPVCRRVSFNPRDVREGYCGACHAYTAHARPPFDPYLVDVVADALLVHHTNALCRLGRVCTLCDCFADEDGGRDRDARYQRYALDALHFQRQTGWPVPPEGMTT